MTATGFNYFQSRAMQPVSPHPGESGYFSAPVDTLDPHLFQHGTDKFRPEVRSWILNTLYTFWDARYKGAREWSTVWLAGSGISFQWAASRGNGDLDVLIGVDFSEFFYQNPGFAGLSDDDMADVFNQEFHASLWPATASTEFSSTEPGGLKQAYEVTFYVNPNSQDIRNIRPYAAFNLSTDEWTVRPPSGPDFDHPKEFFESADIEKTFADTLVAKYNEAARQAQAQPVGSPGWHNSMRMVELAASQAQSMFDNIHLGRKQAFGLSGSGFGDYYNFRWQYHKKNGTVQTLRAVGKAYEDAQGEYARRTYGGPIDGAEVALRRAVMSGR